MKKLLFILLVFIVARGAAQQARLSIPIKGKAISKDTIYIGTMCYSSFPAYYVRRYKVGKKIIAIPDIEANKRERYEFNKFASKAYQKYSKDSIKIWNYYK